MSGDLERTAKEFRERVAEMTREAEKANDPTVKREFLELAEQWKRLVWIAEARQKAAS